jgi:2-polyprenyl-6-methoxyphenol hydroxylase-like FAD-dependent oxidoreductase
MCKLYEERDRAAILWPGEAEQIDALYVFRNNDEADIPQNLESVRAHYERSAWILADVLREADAMSFQLDGATQTIVPQWHRGRITLTGDACGSLGWAGPNAQMAMAGAYVLARELARHADHRDAFAAYQAALKPAIERKQRKAKLCAELLVPKPESHPWLRRLATKAMFSSVALPWVSRWLGAASAIKH